MSGYVSTVQINLSSVILFLISSGLVRLSGYFMVCNVKSDYSKLYLVVVSFSFFRLVQDRKVN
jgi:hypothetical protein